MIKCKNCAMEIPKEARVCPHCGKFLRWTQLAKIFMGVAILFVLGIWFNSRTSSTPPTPAKQQVQNDPEMNFIRTEMNFTKMNNAEHLAEVKKVIAGESHYKGKYSYAKRHLDAIDRNSVEWKGEGRNFYNEIDKQEKRLQKEADMYAKRLKKSQGVSIGMSKQDVLDSNWGRPQRVNTTTTAHGTYEQWIYGSRSYLYFDNGVLTTIQN